MISCLSHTQQANPPARCVSLASFRLLVHMCNSMSSGSRKGQRFEIWRIQASSHGIACDVNHAADLGVTNNLFCRSSSLLARWIPKGISTFGFEIYGCRLPVRYLLYLLNLNTPPVRQSAACLLPDPDNETHGDGGVRWEYSGTACHLNIVCNHS
jgi:hypothetical protein